MDGKVKKGSSYIVPGHTVLYRVRTNAELEEQHEADRRRGSTLDSSGEPRVYSRTGIVSFEEPTILTVIATKGAPWHGWNKRPVGLVRAIVTSGPRIGLEIQVTKRTLLIGIPLDDG